MKAKVRKIVKIITGILSAFYFSFPFIYEMAGNRLQNSDYYEWFFVPEFVYNFFANLTHNGHVIPFIGTLLGAILFWICLFYIFAAIYEIYLDVYLNKKRFEEDMEGD